MKIIPQTMVPMGTVVAFILNKKNIPDGWLLCDGSEIPPEYQELIVALGSSTTPNMAGRTMIGTGKPSNDAQSDGTSPNFDQKNGWPLSSTGGEQKHTLSIGEIPNHDHSINNRNFGLHARSFAGADGNDRPYVVNPKHNIYICITDQAGGDQPHNNMQPYYAVHYIIYTGISSDKKT